MKTYNLGIIGLSPGNGHPYSWAAIFNGYNREKMAECPFPVIPEYLATKRKEDFGIEGAKVTHIWTQDKKISQDVAESSLIPNIAENITDIIGKVDAVILARDDGENHLEMAKPFIEAGLPIFIDKPLTIKIEDLRKFICYYKEGRQIMCCSSARYCKPVLELKEKKYFGDIQTAGCVSPKYWNTYGIHLIEAMYAVMGGGIKSVQNVGEKNKEIVHLKYNDGRHAVLQTFAGIKSGGSSFYGTQGGGVIPGEDAFRQFKRTLVRFVDMLLKTGNPPFRWEETVEMAKIVIAGNLSLKENNRIVYLEKIT